MEDFPDSRWICSERKEELQIQNNQDLEHICSLRRGKNRSKQLQP